VPGDTVPQGQPLNQGDPKDHKRQKEQERYAKMSREKKDDIIKKQRERRMKKKAPTIGKPPCLSQAIIIYFLEGLLSKYLMSGTVIKSILISV
jgi:hypothetical protein